MNEEQVLGRIEEAARQNITVVNLSGSGLTSLPPEIGRLTNLTGL